MPVAVRTQSHLQRHGGNGLSLLPVLHDRPGIQRFRLRRHQPRRTSSAGAAVLPGRVILASCSARFTERTASPTAIASSAITRTKAPSTRSRHGNRRSRLSRRTARRLRGERRPQGGHGRRAAHGRRMGPSDGTASGGRLSFCRPSRSSTPTRAATSNGLIAANSHVPELAPGDMRARRGRIGRRHVEALCRRADAFAATMKAVIDALARSFKAAIARPPEANTPWKLSRQRQRRPHQRRPSRHVLSPYFAATSDALVLSRFIRAGNSLRSAHRRRRRLRRSGPPFASRSRPRSCGRLHNGDGRGVRRREGVARANAPSAAKNLPRTDARSRPGRREPVPAGRTRTDATADAEQAEARDSGTHGVLPDRTGVDRETIRSSTTPTAGYPSRGRPYRNGAVERRRGREQLRGPAGTSRSSTDCTRCMPSRTSRGPTVPLTRTTPRRLVSGCTGGDRADMLRAAGMLRQAPSAGQVSLFTLPSHDDRGAGSRMLSRSRAGRSASDFAQHAAVERTDAADVASNRELMADLAAEGFSAETGDA